MSAPSSTSYAVCKDCGIDLSTPEDASRHGQETMAPVTDEPGITARGHAHWVKNPTPQQLADREVYWIIERALDDACERLDELVEHGKLTAEQVVDSLRIHPDFADAWEAALAESEAQHRAEFERSARLQRERDEARAAVARVEALAYRYEHGKFCAIRDPDGECCCWQAGLSAALRGDAEEASNGR